MARKKNESTVVDETKLQNQENTEAVQTQNDETNTQTVEAPAPETTETNTKASMAEPKPVEISDAVKKLLALYPDHSALYVNAKGGVFPKNAQPSLVKDAILYQNPYFKQ